MEVVGRAEMSKLLPSFALVEKWASRGPADNQVQPGSVLAADDAATDPFHLSHGIFSALSHGVDHLLCFRSLIVDAEALHVLRTLHAAARCP